MSKAKFGQPVSGRTPAKAAGTRREPFHLFDETFKAMLQLSDSALIAFINGLFDEHFPPGSTIERLNNEHADKVLGRRVSDLIVRVNGTRYFHTEVEAGSDPDIVIRVFEYGFLHGVANKTTDKGIRVVEFPLPRVIRIEGNGPATETLRLIFPDKKVYDYEVEVFNLTRYEAAELKNRGLALLLPFYPVKMRQMIQAAKTSEERERLYPRLKELLDHVSDALDGCHKAGVIDKKDARSLYNWLGVVYKGLYGQYEELTEGVITMQTKIKFLSDEIIEEAVAEAREKTSLETAKRFLSMGDSPEKVAKGTGLSLSKVRALTAAPVRESPARATSTRNG
jgi:hypothetical protein